MLGRCAIALLAVAAVACGEQSEPPSHAGQAATAGKPPVTLTVTVAGDARTTRRSSIVVRGRVTRGARVTVRGHRAAVHGSTFRARVTLALGRNRIRVVARLAGHRSKSATITVRRRARPQPAATPTATPTPSSTPKPTCDANYEGACLKPDSPDYDCAGGSGDGPDYTGPVRVVGDDHYDLDRDGDGLACES